MRVGPNVVGARQKLNDLDLAFAGVEDDDLGITEEGEGVDCLFVGPLPKDLSPMVDVHQFFLVEEVGGDDHDVSVACGRTKFEDLGDVAAEGEVSGGGVDEH